MFGERMILAGVGGLLCSNHLEFKFCESHNFHWLEVIINVCKWDSLLCFLFLWKCHILLEPVLLAPELLFCFSFNLLFKRPMRFGHLFNLPTLQVFICKIKKTLNWAPPCTEWGIDIQALAFHSWLSKLNKNSSSDFGMFVLFHDIDF